MVVHSCIHYTCTCPFFFKGVESLTPNCRLLVLSGPSNDWSKSNNYRLLDLRPKTNYYEFSKLYTLNRSIDVNMQFQEIIDPLLER